MRSSLPSLALVVSVILIPSSAAAQTRGSDRPADAAAIRAHIESIFQAFVDKDRAKLEATHGAEWRGFTPWSGHVIRGRDGYMKEATFPPNLPKNQGMVGYRIGEFDIVFYGDTAVVSFQAEVDRLQGTEKSTPEADVHRRLPQGSRRLDSGRLEHLAPSGRRVRAGLAASSAG